MECRFHITKTEQWQVTISQVGMTPDRLAELITSGEASVSPTEDEDEYSVTDPQGNKIASVLVTEEEQPQADVID